MYTIKGINKDNETILLENFSDDIQVAKNKAKELYNTNGLLNVYLVDDKGMNTLLDFDSTPIQTIVAEPNIPVTNPPPTIANNIDTSKLGGLQEIDPYSELDMNVIPETNIPEISNTTVDASYPNQTLNIQSTFKNAPLPTPIGEKTPLNISDELAELELINDMNTPHTISTKPTQKEINPFDISMEDDIDIMAGYDEEIEEPKTKSFDMDKEFKEIGKVITYKDNVYIEDEDGILREIHSYKESKEIKQSDKSLTENFVSEGANKVTDWVFNIQCLDKNDLRTNNEFYLSDIPYSIRKQLAEEILSKNPDNRIYASIEDIEIDEDYDDSHKDNIITEVDEDYAFEDNFNEEELEEQFGYTDEDLDYPKNETILSDKVTEYINNFLYDEINYYDIEDSEDINRLIDDLEDELIYNKIIDDIDEDIDNAIVDIVKLYINSLN